MKFFRGRLRKFMMISFSVILAYLLSYPAYLAYCYDAPVPSSIGVMGPHYNFNDEYFSNNQHFLYIPAEWLIDNSPLSVPYMSWGKIWNVEEKMYIDRQLRKIQSFNPPVK